MLTLDLRNIVLNEAVDEQQFSFTPPEGVKEEDVTQRVIEMIQKSNQPAADPAKPKVMRRKTLEQRHRLKRNSGQSRLSLCERKAEFATAEHLLD